ncbi:MAG TPA: glycosyl hydrolase family 28 protein [Chitinophagaceae bacterium]
MTLNLRIILFYFFCLLSIQGFAQSSWDMVKKIEANIKAPQFKNKDYNIVSFGAKAGGKTDCRSAINKAVTKCSEQGGGRVLIPAGKFYIKGPIVLKSHVNLHLSEGTELIFSSAAEDYLPVVFTRWEGTELYNYSPLIYARNATDIAITGKGLLNGMGTANFATWKPNQKKDQQDLREMGRTGIPVKERVFGKGHYLRPAFLELVDCNNILIEDITLINSTFWVIHPVYCNNVTVRGVTVESKNLNSDGCDPESSTNVLIENCRFVTGDDGIAIKSGRDNDGWRVNKPTENVIIRNCSFETETNAVCIGSEISGGVRNVFVENIRVPEASTAIYFKSNLDRGGFIEHIRVRNVVADSIRTAVIKFEPDYKSESKQNYPTRFRDFVIENISTSYSANYGIDITGFEAMPVSDVTIRKTEIKKTAQPFRVKHAQGVSFNEVVINRLPVIFNQSNKTISLNGTWDVAISDAMPQKYSSKVPVPGIITMATPKLADDLDGIDHNTIDYKYVWYKHQFNLNELAYPDAILKIRAKYNAKVWLNGVEIGYDHYSTYSHAAFDVSSSLNFKGKNELVVRVGSWNTSSSPSKENSAEWWRNTRAPGIWDDVEIELGQDVTTQQIKILPDTKRQITSCEVEIKNRLKTDAAITIAASILDGEKLMSQQQQTVRLVQGEKGIYQLELPSQMLQYWSAGKEGNPKLYRMNVKLVDEEGRILADKNTMFGYRSIEVKGRDVLVNGQKTFFRAENIAFVRSLTRWSGLVFDEKWIRNFLRTAIQDYNFNYLRIHLGHAYSKWYEIADQEGIMLQDEWRYMHDDEPLGKDKEEAEIELTRWVRQNVNHPSIVTWDQENEGNVHLKELKAALHKYDPTRLWGEDDFQAKHIYQYSENIVTTPEYPLPDDKPATILESCRLWTNEFGLLEPRENFKTSRTSSGWGVFYYTKELIGQLLADLHADLGTYFRSARIQAWAPFALLSGWVNGQNFYWGNIADSLTPQPNLLVLKKVNEPVGTSIDMLQAREWYKDKVVYKPNTSFTKKVLAWNDFSKDQPAVLTLTVKDLSGKIISSNKTEITIPAYRSVNKEVSFSTPKINGVFLIEPTLTLNDGRIIAGPTRRIMVASKATKNIEGHMGFGGSRSALAGGHSVIEHFLGFTPSEKIEKAIIAAVGNGLLDKLTIEDDKTFTIQSTVYASSTRSVITRTRIDQSGKTLSSQQSESLNYVDLTDPIKATIVKATGTVPVDESRIIKTTKGEKAIYEISVIGSDLRYRLTISPNGTLEEKEIIKKESKKPN